MTMQLRIITTPEFIPFEIGYLQALFEAGLSCLHVRKPQATPAQYCQLLQNIPAQFHQYIWLHQYPDIAQQFSVGGFHLRSIERATMSLSVQTQFVKGFKDLQIEVGTSVHHPSELDSFADLYDYLMVSPVFSSISKNNYHPSYRWLAPKEDFPTRVVALGGIDVPTIEQAYRRGFKSVACLGAMWNKPHLSVQKYHDLCHSIKCIEP